MLHPPSTFLATKVTSAELSRAQSDCVYRELCPHPTLSVPALASRAAVNRDQHCSF